MTDQARDYYFRDLADSEYVHRSNSELATLQQQALAGDQEAWEALWLHGTRLVHKICKKLHEIGQLHIDHLDDAIQEGNLAIGTALPHWSNNQGKYSTYIWVCARRAVQAFLRDEYAGGITGEKDSKFFHLRYEADITTGGWSSLLAEFYNDPRRESADDRRISGIDLDAALSTLSDKEIYILRKYYYEDQGDPEIGLLLGISKQAVGQQRKKALDALRLYFS